MPVVIWNYALKKSKEFSLDIPKDAHVLSFKVQSGKMMMWVQCNSLAKPQPRRFGMLWTGDEVTPDMQMGKYIGSVIDDDQLVYHLYELGRRAS